MRRMSVITALVLVVVSCAQPASLPRATSTPSAETSAVQTVTIMPTAQPTAESTLVPITPAPTLEPTPVPTPVPKVVPTAPPVVPSVTNQPVTSPSGCKTQMMVLMFHRVPANLAEVGGSAFLSVWLRNFEAYLDWLKVEGYHTATADELYRFTIGKICLPEKSVVLTFDDWYFDWGTTVIPALQKRGMHGILYVIAAVPVNVPANAKLVREWEASGAVEVQSHLFTHQTAYGLNGIYGSVEIELIESKRLLEEITGHKITSLAWPGGNRNAQWIELAQKAGYQTAMMAWGNGTRIFQGSDPMDLPRICIGAADTLETFIAKATYRTAGTGRC